jgi:methylphosphotriester-DNA--protein-cysteine methyltransferase
MNANSSKESLAAATVADPRWHAVVTHDRAADGEFVYSVKSTGVYCRPSCAARTPRPENVAFHATAAEARSAGLRPEQVVEADSVEQIVDLLRRRLRPADDVLVKGSRAMGLEAVAEALAAVPH